MNSKVNLNLGQLLAGVFDFHERPIIASDSPATIPNWDSFQALIMIQELEKAAGISFAVGELKGIKSVGDIGELLRKYDVQCFL